MSALSGAEGQKLGQAVFTERSAFLVTMSGELLLMTTTHHLTCVLKSNFNIFYEITQVK